MRTQNEIIARIKQRESEDFFGFETGDLISCLTFENAKPWLKDGAKSSKWEPQPTDYPSILRDMKKYMEFAWDKANNCRGLSAGRSLAHMQAWLWLLGEDEVVEALEHYTMYGKPHLAAICEHYGVDWKALDNGEWVNSEGGDHQGVTVSQLPFKKAS